MDNKCGHFSTTKKMPCLSYSLSAYDCITTDEICLKICYAKKHHYTTNVVKNALTRNKEKYMDKNWVEYFTYFLKLNNTKDSDYFRWFDSGDMPSIIMLEKICEIATKNPTIKFWLPTRRDDLLIAKWEANNGVKFNVKYPNLSIRLSGKKMEEKPDLELCALLGINYSVVTEDEDRYNCPSKDQEGQCQSCRKCWSQNVEEIVYFAH